MTLLRAAPIEKIQKDGQLLRVKSGHSEYVVANAGGQLYCLDGLCSKAGCFLVEGKIVGLNLICPWHGVEFDLRTGTVLRNVTPGQGAPFSGLRTYPVIVQAGEVFIDV